MQNIELYIVEISDLAHMAILDFQIFQVYFGTILCFSRRYAEASSKNPLVIHFV